jgi:hypothetical protein
MTVKPLTDPRSLSSMLGATIRIAQRMGIHDEGSNSKHPALEAELRRRLWWSLVLFDARISEMTDFRLGQLLPTWDCKLPTNANDFDFRAEMKTPPDAHNATSEALFAVVRSEFGDFTRHASFHLNFINPALGTIAKGSSDPDDKISSLEQRIEEKYLRHCDPQNPLHFVTIWWARGQVAKSRFVKHLSECTKTAMQHTDAHRDAGISYALTMLDCDTKIMGSAELKPFRWLFYLYFPFPAYVQVVQDLRKRPTSEHAEIAWKVMSDNCAARFVDVESRDGFVEKKQGFFFKIFARVVFQAWAAREAAMVHTGSVEAPPQIVTQIKERIAKMEAKARDGEDTSSQSMSADVGMDPSFGSENGLFEMQHMFPAFGDQMAMGLDTRSWGWPTANFHPMLGQGW